MALITDPQAWLSFLTLALLEVVLGIDNIIFLAVLVDRVPPAQRRSARVLGLGFAMLTRIALLFAINWIARMRDPIFAAWGMAVTGRMLILLVGGVFLIANSIVELRETFGGRGAGLRPRPSQRFWLTIVQIGILDIAFSLDSVFTAVGLSNRMEIMVAAIVVSMPVMLGVSTAVNAFIDRYPSLKVLALAFLVLVGAGLVAESVDLEIPKGCMYFAICFSLAIEVINIRWRRRRPPPA